MHEGAFDLGFSFGFFDFVDRSQPVEQWALLVVGRARGGQG